MRKTIVAFLASAVLVMAGASAAKADSFKVVTTSVGFPTNDSVSWASLSGNVPSGTTVDSKTGIVTTIDFPRGGSGSKGGSAKVQCPGSGCTWNGNFAPGSALLTNIQSGAGDGGFDLTFSQGIADVGFSIQPSDNGSFHYVVRALDGSTVLGTWFGYGFSTPQGFSTASFFGLEDSAAHITSIEISTYNCGHGADPTCSTGFAISGLNLNDSPTPEPVSLALLGSGLGLLGLLRRRRNDRG